MAPGEQINLQVLEHEKLTQCCADLQHIKSYVRHVISECTNGPWVCVADESDAFHERRVAIQRSIKLVLGLRDRLAKRAGKTSKIYKRINLGLQKIIDLLDSFD